MGFETIDWDTEAIRVARAFGYDERCVFEHFLCGKPTGGDVGEERTLCWPDGADGSPRTPEWGPHGFYKSCGPELLGFFCNYHVSEGAAYSFVWTGENCIYRAAHFCVDWDGAFFLTADSREDALLLAKGLFNLGLLTPEVEADVDFSITDHQKLEWTLEYKARYGGERK